MSKIFQITEDHERWAKNASRKCRKYGESRQFWIDLIREQNGKCALTGAPLFFDSQKGTPQKGGPGCHPLYAAVDHIMPRRADKGFQILCYDINDLKGHLPPPLFDALKRTEEWKTFTKEWRRIAESSADRSALGKLIKEGVPQTEVVK